MARRMRFGPKANSLAGIANQDARSGSFERGLEQVWYRAAGSGDGIAGSFGHEQPASRRDPAIQMVTY